MSQRKPTLSPTKMIMYLTCPVKYYWTYLNPLGKYYLRARKELTFGATLHRVLQDFHEAGGVEQVQQETLIAKLEERWSEAGFETKEQAETHKTLGKELLHAYFEQQIQVEVPPKILYTEKMLRYDMGQFVLLGRIDRIDEHADGSIEVVDYKSGRSTVTEEQVYEDFAMRCYLLLARAHFPEKPLLASIIALRSGEQARVKLPEAELNEFEAQTRLLGEEMLDRDLETYLPRRIYACDDCDFLKLCQRNAEFDEN